jgi:hypothetical protein
MAAVMLFAGVSYAAVEQVSITLGKDSFASVSSTKIFNGKTVVANQVFGEGQSIVINNGSASFAPSSPDSKYGSVVSPLALDFAGKKTTVALLEERYIGSVVGDSPWKRLTSVILNSDGNVIHQVGIGLLDERGNVGESKDFYFDLNGWYLSQQ